VRRFTLITLIVLFLLLSGLAAWQAYVASTREPRLPPPFTTIPPTP